MRGPAYFDGDHHPLVRYVAAVVGAPDGSLLLTGELEAAGEAMVLDLPATVEHGADRLEVFARADVDARMLGMSWSPIGRLRTPVTLAVRACLRRVG